MVKSSALLPCDCVASAVAKQMTSVTVSVIHFMKCIYVVKSFINNGICTIITFYPGPKSYNILEV